MPLLRENRQGISKSLNWTCTLEIALAIFLFVGSAAHSPAQLPTSAAPPAKAEPTAPIDPLGRETPRRAVKGLLKYAEHQDFATAARYLQPTPGQDTDLVQLAKEFQALHTRFKGDIALLSDDPNGTVEAGLPPGQVRAGVLAVGGTTIDVILVRVDDPAAGKIWLVSKETVARSPSSMPKWKAKGRRQPNEWCLPLCPAGICWGCHSAQWLGWLLSIPISWLLAWLLTFLLSRPGESGTNSENFLSERSGRHHLACRSGASLRS